MTQHTGLYAGTFDPITNGHIDLVARAVKLVDRLVIGVAVNRDKGPLFSLEERVEMIREEVDALSNGTEIVVRPFENLLMHFAEEVILTVSTEGYGKRTSAYEFRRTGRGGQGLLAQDLTKKGGRLAASFPVEEGDEILLVTDQGQLIRTPVNQVRMVGRNTSGVIIFRTSDTEHVVSVERLEGEQSGGDDGDVGDGEGEGEGTEE